MTESTDDLGALLADLDKRGIRLRVDGDALRYTAPPGALTQAVRTRLQGAKAALVERLHGGGAGSSPASFTQRRFWELQRINPDEPFYNVPFLFRLRGSLDAAVLRRGLDAIVQRHEILRTTLRERDGELTQVIAANGEAAWMEADLREVPEAGVRQLLRREMLRRFDLDQDTVFRAVLVRIGTDVSLLQICLHSTAYDLASLIVILREISVHYTAFLAGEQPDLPAPAQYSEYVRRQESLLGSGMAERRRYWNDWFAKGEPPAWQWPSHAGAPPQPRFEAHCNWVRQLPEQTARVHAFCRRHGVTFYIAVLTACLLTLRRYGGRTDLTIGTTYSNRHDWRFASMIGATILVPVVRVDTTDNPTIADLLVRVRDALAAALTFQDVPIDQVVPRESKTPLFSVVCSTFPDTPHGKLRLPGIEAAWEEDWVNPVSRPQLYVISWERPEPAGGVLTCHMFHRQDVFDAGSAAEMARFFQSVLESMVNDATQTAGALSASF